MQLGGVGFVCPTLAAPGCEAPWGAACAGAWPVSRPGGDSPDVQDSGWAPAGLQQPGHGRRVSSGVFGFCAVDYSVVRAPVTPPFSR